LRIAVFVLFMVVLLTGAAFIVFIFEVRACVDLARDCPELVLAGVFLRL
jgi:hypothetical protein